jgi:4-amino-4-deoxy-L-arabinose transferase-like glycosyltransferase
VPRARFRAAFAIVLALAGLLRFATLPARGFWGDELSTVFLVRQPFGPMLHSVARLESTPPLYYALAWLWSKPFGTTEVGMRSLSALLGVATVPIVYAAARELASRRTALVAATLVAVNPMLVWYSQESRSYALLVFLSAAGFFWFARALRTGRALDIAGWAAASCLALTTHYFAAFLVLAEAIALARKSRRRRPLVIALAAVGLTGALLFPLLRYQQSLGHASWISHSFLGFRAAAVPAQFSVGFDAPLPFVLGAAGTVLVLIGAVAAARHSVGRDRNAATVAAAVALGAIAIPLGLAAVGLDYFNARNVLAALLPVTVVLAVGYAAPRARAARFAGGAIVTLSVAIVLATASQPKFHSEDWRDAAHDLHGVASARALVAAPGQAGRKPLEYYAGAKRVSPTRDVLAGEVDVLALPRQGHSSVPTGQVARLLRLRLPGFEIVRKHLEHDFVLLAFRAPRPVKISAATLAHAVQWGTPAVLLEPPRRAAQ